MLTIKITITPLPIITIWYFIQKLNYEIGTAYNIGNTGMLYAETGDEKSNESD
jgi:hypothetical protein